MTQLLQTEAKAGQGPEKLFDAEPDHSRRGFLYATMARCDRVEVAPKKSARNKGINSTEIAVR
jgi:hypothetical protein